MRDLDWETIGNLFVLGMMSVFLIPILPILLVGRILQLVLPKDES
jgi:hypothetical protein